MTTSTGINISAIERDLAELWREEAAGDEEQRAVTRARVLTLIIYDEKSASSANLEDTIYAVTEMHPARVLVLSVDPQAALSEDPQSAVVRECVLSLDVPQTDERSEPFPAWHRAATALADDMDALPVDDQGQAVTLHAFAAIGAELEKLYRQLESLDLAAGSPAARRLFA